jgi:4-hydroxy-2-oxoheptanedioate aldolase
MTPKDSYFAQANEQTLVGVQIEGLKGVQNLNEIIETVGTDLIFIGPYDLSQSLGKPGQIGAPEVQAKVKEIVAAVRARQKAVGIYADTVEDARRWRDLGVQFVAVSVDVRIFLKACQAIVEALK